MSGCLAHRDGSGSSSEDTAVPQSGLVHSRRGPVVRGHDRRRGFSSAPRIERGLHSLKKGRPASDGGFSSVRVRGIAPLLAPRRRVNFLRYAPNRNDPHPTCSPPVPNPPHATARRAQTSSSSRGGGFFARCLFWGGCILSSPAPNGRQVTRDAPRSSGFPQRDTYARDGAARAAREPSTR